MTGIILISAYIDRAVELSDQDVVMSIRIIKREEPFSVWKLQEYSGIQTVGVLCAAVSAGDSDWTSKLKYVQSI